MLKNVAECDEKLEYYELVQRAKELVLLNPSVDQVIIVKTEKSNIYHFTNRLYIDGMFTGKSEDKEKFVEMLSDKKDQVIIYIVCMWNCCSIDVPSMNFRELLLEASEKNAEAMLVLQSVTELILTKMGMTMKNDINNKN